MGFQYRLKPVPFNVFAYFSFIGYNLNVTTLLVFFNLKLGEGNVCITNRY